MKTFLVENDGYSKPRVFQKEPLDLIGQADHFGRIFSISGIIGTAYLSQSVTVNKYLLCLFETEVTVIVQQYLCFAIPYTHHLRDLFRKGHA